MPDSHETKPHDGLLLTDVAQLCLLGGGEARIDERLSQHVVLEILVESLAERKQLGLVVP